MVYNILYTIIATVGEYVIGMLFSGKSKIQELISYTVYITTLNGRLHEPAHARTHTHTRSLEVQRFHVFVPNIKGKQCM